MRSQDNPSSRKRRSIKSAQAPYSVPGGFSVGMATNPAASAAISSVRCWSQEASSAGRPAFRKDRVFLADIECPQADARQGPRSGQVPFWRWDAKRDHARNGARPEGLRRSQGGARNRAERDTARDDFGVEHASEEGRLRSEHENGDPVPAEKSSCSTAAFAKKRRFGWQAAMANRFPEELHGVVGGCWFFAALSSAASTWAEREFCQKGTGVRRCQRNAVLKFEYLELLRRVFAQFESHLPRRYREKATCIPGRRVYPEATTERLDGALLPGTGEAIDARERPCSAGV